MKDRICDCSHKSETCEENSQKGRTEIQFQCYIFARTQIHVAFIRNTFCDSILCLRSRISAFILSHTNVKLDASKIIDGKASIVTNCVFMKNVAKEIIWYHKLYTNIETATKAIQQHGNTVERKTTLECKFKE